MNWFWWFLIGVLAFEAAAGILLIDVPRKARSKSDAFGVAIANALLIWGIVTYAGAK